MKNYTDAPMGIMKRNEQIGIQSSDINLSSKNQDDRARNPASLMLRSQRRTEEIY